MPLGGPISRRFYLRCGLVCIAGFVLSVIGAFTVFYLESPRVGMERPWFHDVRSACEALMLFFSLALAIFKFFASMSSGPGDSSE